MLTSTKYAVANPKPIVHMPEAALFELKDKRTRTGKSFLMEKGSRRQIITIGHQHYWDGEQWKDVDNAVLSTENGFECWKTSYFWLAHQTGIGCNYKSRAGGFSRTKLLSVGNSPPIHSFPIANDNCLFYDNVAHDTDFHWQLYPSKVAGWLTLHSDAAPREWKWEFIHSGKVCIARSKIGLDANGDKLEIECDIDTETIKPGLFRTILTKRWTGRVAKRNKKTRKLEYNTSPAYPVCIDPDISEEITADIDDGYEGGSGGGWENGMGPYLGEKSTDAYHAGWRFVNVAVRQGDTIDLANFKIYQSYYYGNGGAGTMYGVDADTAPDFAATVPTAAAKTTANATWSANAATGQLTEDVTTIVAEIAGRGGWVGQNNIGLFILESSANGNKSGFTGYSSAGKHGRLEIDYTQSSGGGGGGLAMGNGVFNSAMIRGI